ncbi:hypothetical protein DENSPDRAFT_886234 [Dentipellis sp. KUC8613]|nr:hypothetical protein DENSPDRAFT_886234 [Dentipellis sp. KUC8613]
MRARDTGLEFFVASASIHPPTTPTVSFSHSPLSSRTTVPPSLALTRAPQPPLPPSRAHHRPHTFHSRPHAHRAALARALAPRVRDLFALYATSSPSPHRPCAPCTRRPPPPRPPDPPTTLSRPLRRLLAPCAPSSCCTRPLRTPCALLVPSSPPSSAAPHHTPTLSRHCTPTLSCCLVRLSLTRTSRAAQPHLRASQPPPPASGLLHMRPRAPHGLSCRARAVSCPPPPSRSQVKPPRAPPMPPRAAASPSPAVAPQDLRAPLHALMQPPRSVVALPVDLARHQAYSAPPFRGEGPHTDAMSASSPLLHVPAAPSCTRATAARPRTAVTHGHAAVTCPTGAVLWLGSPHRSRMPTPLSHAHTALACPHRPFAAVMLPLATHTLPAPPSSCRTPHSRPLTALPFCPVGCLAPAPPCHGTSCTLRPHQALPSLTPSHAPTPPPHHDNEHCPMALRCRIRPGDLVSRLVAPRRPHTLLRYRRAPLTRPLGTHPRVTVMRDHPAIMRPSGVVSWLWPRAALPRPPARSRRAPASARVLLPALALRLPPCDGCLTPRQLVWRRQLRTWQSRLTTPDAMLLSRGPTMPSCASAPSLSTARARPRVPLAPSRHSSHNPLHSLSRPLLAITCARLPPPALALPHAVAPPSRTLAPPSCAPAVSACGPWPRPRSPLSPPLFRAHKPMLCGCVRATFLPISSSAVLHQLYHARVGRIALVVRPSYLPFFLLSRASTPPLTVLCSHLPAK